MTNHQLPLFPSSQKRVSHDDVDDVVGPPPALRPSLIHSESINWRGTPIVNDVDLYRRLENCYSATVVFRSANRKSPPREQPILSPIEHNGKFYISFGGSCALERVNSRGESITIMEAYATPLYKPEEYEGTLREFVSHMVPPTFYEGLLVVDPEGRKWVVGKEEFVARAFELENGILVADPETRIEDL